MSAQHTYHVSTLCRLLAICLTASLSACGGGGGGGSGSGSGSSTFTGDTLVFSADKDTDGVTELYAVREDGSGLRKLSGTMVSGGNVSLFKLSPDRSKVAYSADQDTDGIIELYVVDIDGSNLTKVSLGLGANADVYHGNTNDAFWWSPDSTRLVYLADADIDEIRELFLVNADGSDHHKINGSVGSPTPVVQIGQAKWSPDGRYVAYYVRTLNPFYSGFAVDRIAINTHDTATGQPNSVRVSGTLAANQPYWVNDMSWSPDSTRIAYTSYENIPALRELYIAIADQTAQQTRVNVPLSSGQGVLFRTYWSDDSRYLLYAVNGSTTGNGLYTHDTQNLTPRNGAKISGDMVSGGNSYTFVWSPDNSRIAYLADQDTDEQSELYSALPGAADSAVKISGVLPVGAEVYNFSWSPDSRRVVYLADQDTAGVIEAFTASASGGGATTKVSATLTTDDDINGVPAWSPGGDLLSYHVINGTGAGLYITEADTALNARRITGNTIGNGINFRQTRGDNYTAMPWNRDGSALLFSYTDNPILTPRRLYRANIGDTQGEDISGTLVTGGDVLSFDY